MELLQLKYFLESAECGSFSVTAKKHMVPTTSVSAAVKRLEQEIGHPLFDRSANKIFLNKNGKRLKEALLTAFFEIETAVADIASEGDEREIKMLVRAVRSDICDYIIEFNKRHPAITFNAVFDFDESNYEKYDLIIDEKNNAYAGYSDFCLVDMCLKIKMAKRKFKLPRKLTLSDLAKLPFVSWGDSSNMHRILISVCRAAGFEPKIAIQLNDKECYDKMLKAGVGIGLERETPETDLSELEYLDIKDFNEHYTVFCYYNPKAYSGNVKSFVDFLKTKQA